MCHILYDISSHAVAVKTLICEPVGIAFLADNPCFDEIGDDLRFLYSHVVNGTVLGMYLSDLHPGQKGAILLEHAIRNSRQICVHRADIIGTVTNQRQPVSDYEFDDATVGTIVPRSGGRRRYISLE